MNVAQLLLDNVERFGEYPIIHFAGARMTNVELERYSARLAGVLRERGVGPGDRVLLVIPNSPEVMASFLAVWRLGAVPLPATPQLGAPELALPARELGSEGGAYRARARAAAGRGPHARCRLRSRSWRSGPSRPRRRASDTAATSQPAVEDLTALIAAAEPVDALVDCGPDQLALLLYTSGTTGQPKGVMISQRAVVGLGQPKVTARSAAADHAARASAVARVRREHDDLHADEGTAVGDPPALEHPPGVRDDPGAARRRDSRWCRPCSPTCSSSRSASASTPRASRWCGAAARGCRSSCGGTSSACSTAASPTATRSPSATVRPWSTGRATRSGPGRSGAPCPASASGSSTTRAATCRRARPEKSSSRATR